MEYTFQGYSKHMKDKLAIIVPYRDRQEHLDVFIPHMHQFLKDKGIDYTIFIAEQADPRPFNYGKLCNSVVKELPEEYNYFAFHDVDMLPISDECDYGYPDSPTHLATNVEAHENKLPYPQYFGGAIVISREDFENANGFSNEYWGYGFQDLDLLYRLQKSGAYLEKYYDLNQTYSKYDSDDILPHRIENVKITNNKKTHSDYTIVLQKNSKLYSPINKFTLDTIQDDFFVSFWFNDFDDDKKIKNLFSFEGCDTGVFLSNGKALISQIWDLNGTHYQVSINYYKNKWNHVVFAKQDNKLVLYLNNQRVEEILPEDFKIYDYSKNCIKISDDTTNIKISSIKIFSSKISDEICSQLYFNGNKVLDLIQNKYGCQLKNHFTFKSVYKERIFLDSSKNLNHLMLYGRATIDEDVFSVTDEIYLPYRTEGKYQSLVHTDDDFIIERYYEYNPDIEENADIFFHDVITNKLDYKTVGLNTLKYKILHKENKKAYELIRIVT